MNNQSKMKLFGLLFIIALGCTSCATRFTYEPPYIPIQFQIDLDGNISIQAEKEIRTPLGEFGFESGMPPSVDQGLLIIFHDNRQEQDRVYHLCTEGDEFSAIINGKTVIQITRRKITIDISDGTVESVEIKVQGISNTRVEGGCSRWKPYAFNYQPFNLFWWAFGSAKPERAPLLFVAQCLVAFLLFFVDLILIFILTPSVALETWIAPPAGTIVRNIYIAIISLAIIFGPLLCLAFDCKLLLRRKK